MIYKTMRKAAEAHAGAHASRVTSWEAYERQLIRRRAVTTRPDPNREGFYLEYVVIEPEDWFGIDRNGTILSGPHKFKRNVVADLGVKRTRRIQPGIFMVTSPVPDDPSLIGRTKDLVAAGYDLRLGD